MHVPLLDLTAQYRTIRDEVWAALEAVVESQRFILGEPVQRLEQAIAELCGVAHGIGCASGTDALLLPLRALQLKPGDEVITTAFTFFATAGAVHNAGGTPVFVDILPDTFNLDPDAVERALTPRTRAILPVHLFGQMAALERLVPLARARDIPLIEDACQAIGARRRADGGWRRAGETGWASAFSFFPSKNLGGWGDGGMIVTPDADTAERLRRLRQHGGAKQYHHDEVGLNSRLDALQAAVLNAKRPHLAAWSAARRERAAYYTAELAGVDQVRPPVTDPDNEHIFHQYTVRAERRDALREHLGARGVTTAVYYPVPLHRQPCFAHLDYRAGSLPETERAAGDVLSLPVYPELTQAQQDHVLDAIRAFYR